MKAGRVLIDTSAWIVFHRRRGAKAVRDAVQALVESDRVALCDMVMLELWNGARSGPEQTAIRDLEATYPTFETTPEVWAMACSIARTARRKGITVPAPDLVIFAVSEHYQLELLHRDAHFDALASLSDG